MPDIKCPNCGNKLGEETEKGLIVHKRSVRRDASTACASLNGEMMFWCGGKKERCDYRGVWKIGVGWKFTILNELK